MPTRKQISREVKAERESLGLSQTEFAKRCDVSQPVISQLDLAKHEPRLSTLAKIAKAIGKKLNFGDDNGKIFRAK